MVLPKGQFARGDIVGVIDPGTVRRHGNVGRIGQTYPCTYALCE